MLSRVAVTGPSPVVVLRSGVAAASSTASSSTAPTSPAASPPRKARSLEVLQKHLLSGVGPRVVNESMDYAKGSYVWTKEGKKYLDFTVGIGVVGTGHSHPRVQAAVKAQVDKVAHVQYNVMYNVPQLQLIDRLLDIMPHPSLDTFFFNNSGSEAIETSVKIARLHTKRPNIIAFHGGFHGRSFGALSMTTSKTVYGAGMFVTPAAGAISSTPYCYHCKVPRDGKECCLEPLAQLKAVLKTQSAPGDTAAVLIEPVQGEGGYVPMPDSFLQGVRALCDEHKMLMIVDEVQSGFCRTGKYFAIEHAQVVPDIIVMAKAIGSGYPLSGIATKEAIGVSSHLGAHGGTYGGNAVACAAAVATLDIMRDEKLCENAIARGAQLVKGLKALQKEVPQVGDVRGRGLMIGVEFGQRNLPYGTAGKVTAACKDRGLLMMSASAYETIRFMPPLTVSEAEVDEALGIFGSAVKSVFK